MIKRKKENIYKNKKQKTLINRETISLFMNLFNHLQSVWYTNTDKI